MRIFSSLILLALWLWGDAHIFVYHRFGDPQRASANTQIHQLQAQFEYFKKNGYKVIPLQKLSDALRAGMPIDPKWVVLTIDDAYRSFYDNALSLFKSYNYPFTLFVYVEATHKGYKDYMSWQQLKDASAYGEVALHSYGHPHLTPFSSEAVKEDTQRAIALFQKNMGYRPSYYAYPYGEYTNATKKAIRLFDFDLILNQNNGAISNASDPYNLDRIALTGEVDLASKLRIDHLDALWIEPKSYPRNAVLKTIHAKISPSIRNIEYFVSGYGWEPAVVQNGEVKISLERPLKQARSRIFIRSGSRYSSTIIVKE